MWMVPNKMREKSVKMSRGFAIVSSRFVRESKGLEETVF